jgi:hypothetical protein
MEIGMLIALYQHQQVKQKFPTHLPGPGAFTGFLSTSI